MSDIDDLVRDLEHGAKTLAAETLAATEKAMLAVRDAARDAAPKDSGAYAQSITAEVEEQGGTVVGEVGPDARLPHGNLGAILEFGTVNMGPRPHLRPAHDREVTGWENTLGDVLEEAAGGTGRS